MKLEQVEIKNFRSIKNATIDFKPSCRVLVGMNESGKSNILKALRLLDRNALLGKDDKREPSLNEKHIKDSYVEFAFTPGEGDAQKWLNAASSEILYKGSLPNISSADGKTTTLVEIFSLFVPVLYRVNIGDRKKPVHAFHFVGSKFTYAPQQGDEWFKPTEHCPSEIFKNHLLTEDTPSSIVQNWTKLILIMKGTKTRSLKITECTYLVMRVFFKKLQLRIGNHGFKKSYQAHYKNYFLTSYSGIIARVNYCPKRLI